MMYTHTHNYRNYTELTCWLLGSPGLKVINANEFEQRKSSIRARQHEETSQKSSQRLQLFHNNEMCVHMAWVQAVQHVSGTLVHFTAFIERRPQQS